VYFEDFTPGYTITTPGRTITEADIVAFAGLSGDFHPIHTDETYARQTPFGRRVAHGALILSISLGLATRLSQLGDTLLALGALDKVRFSNPVFAGDTISVKKRVFETMEMDAIRGVVIFHTHVHSHDQKMVLSYTDKLLVRRRAVLV
jgi:acyl dehydratase